MLSWLAPLFALTALAWIFRSEPFGGWSALLGLPVLEWTLLPGYRGFLLAGLTALVGYWPAAVLTSVAFGLSHDQYPLALQGLIMGVSVLWCWLVRRTRSLWAAWGAHMVLDVVIDAIWG